MHVEEGLYLGGSITVRTCYATQMALHIRLYAGALVWVGLRVRHGEDDAGEVARMAKAVSFLRGLTEKLQGVSLPAPTARPVQDLELRKPQLGVWVLGTSVLLKALEALVVHISGRF